MVQKTARHFGGLFSFGLTLLGHEPESNNYILDNSLLPVKPQSEAEWRAFKDDPRMFCLAYTKLRHVAVSTVFLKCDHSFGLGEPVFYETMIFDSQHELEIDERAFRYKTREEAMLGHLTTINIVKAAQHEADGKDFRKVWEAIKDLDIE